MNMKKYIYLIITALCFSLYSCDNEVEPGGTQVQNLAGDWYVRLLFDDGSGNWTDGYDIGYYRLETYNTAANLATEMFVDDNNTWPMKGKVKVDVSGLSFKTDGDTENYYLSQGVAYPFKVNDGKVFPKGGTALSGTVTDSICMHVEYSDDPGTVYRICGIKRTGFPADEY